VNRKEGLLQNCIPLLEKFLPYNYAILFTDRVSGQGTVVGFVRPFARLFPLQLFKQLTFDFDFYRAMLCIRGTSHGPVSDRLSVTSRSSTKMAERIELGFGM